MRTITIVVASAVALSIGAPAYAHVTIQPDEAVAGSFSRFVVRVPTERDVPTLEVSVKLPPLAFLSFEDKSGWRRSEKTGKFEEPLEAFGQEITEGVTQVTWSGGRIGPGEFAEFGFSAALPEGQDQLRFKAIQTYRGGEVVRWVGGPEAEAPAPRVALVDLPAEEGEGQLALLASLAEQVESLESELAAASADHEGEEPPAEAASDDEEDDGPSSTLAVILGASGLALGAIALLVALTRRKA